MQTSTPKAHCDPTTRQPEKAHTLLTPMPVFSPASRDELKRAVEDCLGVRSQGNRPARLHGPIGKWDVSQVTDMRKVFSDLKDFDFAVSDWDVSRVAHMRGMFAYAISFNQDLSKWDVSSVVNMAAMFQRAVLFNGDISKWDVSSVNAMRVML